MSLRGSHGYRIRIDAFGDGFVELSASRGGASAEYDVPGRVTPGRIEANFGRVGRVSLHFAGDLPRPKPLRGDCKGRKPVHAKGRFQGEEDFTSVSATAAKGSITHSFRETCQAGSERRPRARRGPRARASSISIFETELTVAKAEAHRGIGLLHTNDVVTFSSGKERVEPTLDSALLVEDRGRVFVERIADVEVDADPLPVSPLGQEPVSATLALPSPFAGAGSYLEAAGSAPAWSGDLSVQLPGAGTVPLSGPGFKAILCRGILLHKKLENCEHEAISLFIDGTTPLSEARPGAAPRARNRLYAPR
jgi:hypothetical protein